MTPWVTLAAVLVSNALAAGAPRVSGNVRTQGGASAPAVIPQLGSLTLTPGAGLTLSASLNGAVAPLSAPLPRLDAMPPLGAAAADAPAARPQAPAAVAMTAPQAVAAERAAAHAAPSALGLPAAEASADTEGGAAPKSALESASWAASNPQARIEVVFDGGKAKRSWLDELVLMRPLRPTPARLTRGVRRDLDRYQEPPAIVRRVAALQASALAGGLGSLAAFSVAGGPVLAGVLAAFIGLTGFIHWAQRGDQRAIMRSQVVSAQAFEARAQALLDDMRRAVGATKPVRVRVMAGMNVNAAWHWAHPDTVFLTYGASVLDDGRLRAVMAHELGHRRFRDDYGPLHFGRAAASQAAWIGGGVLGVNAALAAFGVVWFLPLGPSLLALGLGLLGSALAQWALAALPRVWEFRADHYAGWLTHPRDMANALGFLYRPGQTPPRTLGALVFGTHPDTRRRIVELRGYEGSKAKARIPAGVMDALAKAALVMPSMAALSWYVWHVAAPSLGFGTFAATFLPLPLLSLHFGLIGLFWAGRYFAYPKLGPAGRGAFLAVSEMLAVVYPLAALTALGFWTASLFGAVPAALSGFFIPWTALFSALTPGAAAFMLGLMGVIGLIALAEVVHHFVWRAPTKKDRGGVWGNLGQQLLRMRRKG